MVAARGDLAATETDDELTETVEVLGRYDLGGRLAAAGKLDAAGDGSFLQHDELRHALASNRSRRGHGSARPSGPG